MQCFESDPEVESVDASLSSPGLRKGLESKQSEDVVSEKINPLLAFEAFAGKIFEGKDRYLQLSSNRTEFSHEILPTSKQHFETPLDRYNRLKSEVEAFQKDMAILQKEAASPDNGIQEFSRNISRDLGVLGDELVALEREYRPLLSVKDVSASDQALVTQLMAQVKALQQNNQQTAASSPNASQGGFKYELYYSALGEGEDQTKRRTQQDVQALDRRIASLEQRLGFQDVPYPSLEAGLADLHKKLLLLDEGALDRLAMRVTQLNQAFDKLQASQSGAAKKADSSDKVEHVYAQMNKWDSAAQRLPVVIERLHSLRYVHEEAADATMRLQAVEDTSNTASRLLQEDRETLAQLKAAVQANAQKMEANISSLLQRLQAMK
eukprot:g48211.t1